MTLTRHPALSAAFVLACLVAGALMVQSIAWIALAFGDAGVVAIDAGVPLDAGLDAAPVPDPPPPVAAPAPSTSDLLALWRGGQLGAALALALHALLPRLLLAWPLLARIAPALATRRRLALVSSLAAGVGSIVPLAVAGQPVLLALSWQVAVAIALWLWPELRKPAEVTA